MKNRVVGFIVVTISLIIGFITWSFNRALTAIVSTSCTHGDTCPMWGDIKFQTNVSIGLVVFVMLVGFYLIFFGQERVEIIKKIRERVKSEPKKNYSKLKLSAEEKKLMNIVLQSEGAMFQSDLVEKSGFDKVKVSRLLDRLEGQQLIERKRRGMTNIVILK
jgi:uncharacterized membrane protein